MSRVRSLPVPPVFCWNCKHARLQEDGSYCLIYSELILVESEAQSCSLFAPREDK
ncbi:MAG: hypothetical protein ACXVYY_00965 [Oryzihumus sp.]